MGESAFGIGWAITRDEYAHAVPPLLRRRRTMIAGIVAGGTGTLITVTEVSWRWAPTPWPLAALGIMLLAAALGTLVATFASTTPATGVDLSFVPSGDWRRQDRVGAQFGRNPPEMDPQDRDVVLATAERSRVPLVRAAARLVLLPAAWGFAFLGIVATGLSLDSLLLFAMPIVFGTLQSGGFVGSVVGLGRTELARRRAEALPPTPPAPPRTWPRGTGPSGSKLGLPAE